MRCFRKGMAHFAYNAVMSYFCRKQTKRMTDGVFRFQQFSISHKNCAMKIGTDGVLLGSWCDVSDATHVLDVGCGSGLIALMVAQRNTTAMIDAVEIDGLAAAEAAENFRYSPWKDRLTVYPVDFLAFESNNKYDLIVSNPPFFKTDTMAPDKRRAMARNENSLPFEKLLLKAKSLLAPSGIFALIAPVEVKESIEFWAGENNLWLKRRVGVKSSERKRIKRYLWEFTDCECSVEDRELCLRDGDGYSTDYKELTRNFYLYLR